MTHIETDNPLIQYRVWWYDFIWNYPVLCALLYLLAVWLMYEYFKRK